MRTQLSARSGIRQVNWLWLGHVTLYRNGQPWVTYLLSEKWDTSDDAYEVAYQTAWHLLSDYNNQSR